MKDEASTREATIRDVARCADVSVASVSRALNRPSTVHPETRARVLKVVEELRYVPHAGARSLSLRSSHALGVVLPDLHGEFFSELVRGMDREANALGFQLLLATMHDDPGLAGHAMRAMRGRVDGWIVMAPQLTPAAVEAILPKSPTVLINCFVDGHANLLGVDNRHGIDLLVAHLVAQGRRRIVHVAGPSGNFDALERAEAFRRAVLAATPEAEPTILDGDFTEEAGRRAVARLAADGTRFDAIVAANDMSALGALGALREAGVAVPEEVAVAGFDDIPLARYLGLTTVQVRMDQLGAQAVGKLAAELRGERAGTEVELLKPTLVVRASTEQADA